MSDETYVCPGCGRVHHDCEDHSLCMEYHGDHPDSITTPVEWKNYWDGYRKRLDRGTMVIVARGVF